MKQVFIDIERRLKEIDSLRYISEDWGQLNFERPPVNYPCALIDLGEADCSQAGNRSQMVEAVARITIADIRYQGIHPEAPEADRERAFGIFDLIDEVNRALHGRDGDSYTPLNRVKIKKVMRPDQVREFVITYAFGYTDMSAAPERIEVKAAPQIRMAIPRPRPRRG